jgi:hypothetical protein
LRDAIAMAKKPESVATFLRGRRIGVAGVSRQPNQAANAVVGASQDAVRECAADGIDCIAGGCPLMFCDPVDVGHKCMRWWLQHQGRVPT